MKQSWWKRPFTGTTALLIFFQLIPTFEASLDTDRSSHGRAHAATASAATSPLDQIIEGAKREGQAVVRVPTILAAKEGFESAINHGVNKTWGLNLKIRIVPSGGMDADVATVISEINSGRQPSWDSVVGTASTLHRLKQRGGIEAVDWPGIFPKITPRMTEKGLDGIILSVDWYVPYYNTRSTSKEDLASLPKKWEDFLDPRWKGKLIHPLGSHQQVLLARVWGEEKTAEFTRQLANQDLLKARWPEAKSRLFAGERPLAYFGDYPQWFNDAEDSGAPVKPVLGLNPQPVVYFMLVVTKNARHPNATKLALAYLVTAEAQQLIYKLAKYGSPFVPGSPIEKIQKEMEDKGSRFVTFGDLEQDEKRQREYGKILGF
ncbi:MAG: ABC transporter substrate-binding protein [Deltaproteobacteria bacterium]|nr:ABC transporter substrate-binding protein [Deltaproteobacteria bacterium]